MPKKRYTPEEIVAKLRHVDVLLGQGKQEFSPSQLRDLASIDSTSGA